MLTTLAEMTDENIAQYLPKLEVFSNLYEQHIAIDDGNHAERPPGIHASEISNCQLKAYHTLCGLEKRKNPNPNPMWQKKFKIGHAIHAMIQGELHRMAKRSNGLLSFADEVPITPYTSAISNWYKIYSSCDGVITLRERDERGRLIDVTRMILEIKSSSPTEYEKLKAPKPEHIEQAHVYMACLDIPFAWILYYNKGNENYTSSRGAFLVKFNHELWDSLTQRIELLMTQAESGTPPPPIEGIWCEWCDYGWNCKPKYLARKQGGFGLGPPRTGGVRTGI